GHQQLLAKTLAAANELGGRSVALTFSPRPEDWFRGKTDGPLLFSESQKHRALTEFGIDDHVVQPFDDAFSLTSHTEFTTECLRKRLNARAVVVGDNFRFGHKRKGDAEFLRDAGTALGMEVFVIPAAYFEQEPISSTRIRAAVQAGEVALAQSLLGRPYIIEGKVAKGDQLGRRIEFPTANVSAIEQLIPATGVYAAWLCVGDQCRVLSKAPAVRHKAVVNIGYRP